MSGFFGCITKSDAACDVFYGADYHSHLGTKRAGMAFFSKEKGFQRAIHSLEDGYFRNKFENDIKGFSETSLGSVNPTELIAMLITEGKTFLEGIQNVFDRVKGSCSMLILTEDGLLAARDKLGRTPVVIGKKENAYSATFETADFKEYSDSKSSKYEAMVESIRQELDLTTLTFQKLEDLVEAIGLPKEKLCTHCWDGSSYF